MLSIVLFEGDHIQAGWITNVLLEAFPGIDIRTARTEYSFYHWLNDVARGGVPNLVILAVQGRWADPGESLELKPSEDAIEGGFFQAGIRCAQRLLQVAPKVPIIFYTTLGHDRLPASIGDLGLLVSKGGGPGPLLEAVRGTHALE